MLIDFGDILMANHPTVQTPLNTLGEMESEPLKGVGHLIEVKTIERPLLGLDYWLLNRVAI